MLTPISEKRLRIGLTYNGITDLPPDSQGRRKNIEEIYAAVAEAGYEAIQGGDARLCHSYGLEFLGLGVIPTLWHVEPWIRSWKEQGAVAATCIAGYGYESDAEIDSLAESIMESARTYELPVFIETHRASITQDAWRTVQLTRRLPGVRFNGDFSHWFTGQEMIYGDFTARLEKLTPIFECIRFLHGRIGNRCCMQVDIGKGTDHPSIPYFRSFWTRSMQGFLRASDSGRDLWFCPELLGTEYQYAHTICTESGSIEEQGDRWTQSAVLVRLARQCFEQAVASSGTVARSNTRPVLVEKKS